MDDNAEMSFLQPVRKNNREHAWKQQQIADGTSKKWRLDLFSIGGFMKYHRVPKHLRAKSLIQTCLGENFMEILARVNLGFLLR